MFQLISYIIIGFVICFSADNILIRRKINKQSTRWFFIHFIINSLVTVYSFSDVCYCVTNPDTCYNNNWLGGIQSYAFVISLHFYHIFFFKLTLIDWLHHISMIIISAPIVLTFTRTSAASMAIWFLSGFPGMIDYFLLWLVKMNWLRSSIEKYVYVLISVWIRQPGCVITSALALKGLTMYNEISISTLLAIIWNIFIVYWNGCFFMHLTLADYYKKNDN